MYFPDIALLIRRIIAGGFFLMNGVNHFAKLNVMTGYAKSKGTFAPAHSVGSTGVIRPFPLSQSEIDGDNP
jgi:uncharacterized membrane protein YphA (DoxX/SURF4 family)